MTDDAFSVQGRRPADQQQQNQELKDLHSQIYLQNEDLYIFKSQLDDFDDEDFTQIQVRVFPLMYHVIMLFEFAQLLFFVFYSVEITNEFKSLQNGHHSVFRIDYYLTFTNFQFYVLQLQSPSSFITLFATLTGLFLVFIIVSLLFAKKIFQEERNDTLTYSTRILVKLFTILMTAFLFLMQIPMFTIYLQGLLCEEDSSLPYTLKDMQCFSGTHSILITLSTISLVVYLSFLIIQSLLYTSNGYDSQIPWASVERHLSTFKILIKFILVATFVFDKKGKIRGQVDLACFFLFVYIVYKRMTTAIIFEKSVLYATIIYEVMQMWLFLVISINIMAEIELQITGFILILVTGLLFSITLVFYQQSKAEKYLQNDVSIFKSASDHEIYFFHLYKMIPLENPEARMQLHGILCNHMCSCINPKCPCISIMQVQDNVKMNHFDQEEERRIMLQSSNTNDNRFGSIMPGDTVGNPKNGSNNDFKSQQTYRGFSNSRGKDTIEDFTNLNDRVIQQRRDIYQEGVSRRIPRQSAVLATFVGPSFSDIKTYSDLTRTIANVRDGAATQKSMFNNQRTRRNVTYTIGTIPNIGNQNANDSSIINKKPPERILTERKKRKQLYQWYRFLTVMMEQSIEKFPKHVELKITSSFIQNRKLKNEFKSLFLLMNAESYKPSFQDQFIIFRRKFQIEQLLRKSYQKNIQDIGKIDVKLVYQYERYFQNYSILEYRSAISAMRFWNELLQKEVNTDQLQERGAEISENFVQIQKLMEKISKIYPNDIKFFFRYGTFLYKVINNAYDAVGYFEKIYYSFQGRQSKKNQPFNELTIFGENSGCAIIVISATSKTIGQIMHANEEVEQLFGYQRKDLLNKNVNIIMPRPIGKVHDKLIERYFDTAIPTVIDQKRQLFAVQRSGYLVGVRLLVKVYPNISNRIDFVGFVQYLDKFDDMVAVKYDYVGMDQQYIITDEDNNITNVTEGLNQELGLNSKFFKYSDSIFQTLFNFTKICPDINQFDIQDQLEDEGVVITIDTSNMLQFIELESLSSEEILDIRTKLGIYECYVQMKTMIIDKNFCKIKIFRVCIINKLYESMHFASNMLTALVDDPSAAYKPGESSSQGASAAEEIDDLFEQSQMASFSSTSSGSYSYNKAIKDFKKTLGEKKTPKIIVNLNRILIVYIILIIGLASTDYGLKQSEIGYLNSANNQALVLQTRNSQFIDLITNVRSLLNCVNNLEFNQYDIKDPLTQQNIDRKQYLLFQVIRKAQTLTETHKILTQKRDQSSLKYNAQIKVEDVEQSEVNLFRQETNGKTSSYSLKYSVALDLYLSLIFDTLNRTLPEMLISNLTLKALPSSQIYPNGTKLTDQEKGLYFILVNGLRDLREVTEKAANVYIEELKNQSSASAFLIILIIGIILSFAHLIIIIYLKFKINTNQMKILQLYGLLKIKEIKDNHQKCEDFLESLKYGHLLPRKKQPTNTNEQQKSEYISINPSSLNLNQQASSFSETKRVQNQNQMNALKEKNMQIKMNDHESIMSEEEKEAELYKQYMRKKKASKYKSQQIRKADMFALASGQNIGVSPGEERQKLIMKRVMETIREIQTIEQQQIDLQKTKRQKEKLDVRIKRKQKQLKKSKPTSAQHNIVSDEEEDEDNQLSQPKQTLEKQRKKASSKRLSSISQNQTQKPPASDSQNPQQIKNKAQKIQQNQIDSSFPIPETKVKFKETDVVRRLSISSDGKEEEIQEDNQQNEKPKFSKQVARFEWLDTIGLIFFTLIVSSYFAYSYSYKLLFETQHQQLLTILPPTFKRQTDFMLSYNFLREGIINMAIDPKISYNETFRFLGFSLEDGQMLFGQFEILKTIDSPQFCNYTAQLNDQESCCFQEIQAQCEQFQQNFLSKGLQQVLANFNKKLTDIQLTIASLQFQNVKISKYLSILLREKLNNAFDSPFQSFFQFVELYYQGIEKSIENIWSTQLQNETRDALIVIQAIYLVFIVFIVFSAIILKYKLIQSLKKRIYLIL